MEKYSEYVRRMREIADLKMASAVLQWDQETYLPKGGAELRGQQLSTLTTLAHSRFTENEFGELLKELSNAKLEEKEKLNILRTNEDYNRSRKYSEDLVRRLSDQVNKTFHTWIEAREKNSFEVYLPQLEKLVELKKEEAQVLGYAGHPYDALLDEFEKGTTTKDLDSLFEGMLPPLQDLLTRIGSAEQVDDSFLKQPYERNEQWSWSMELLKHLHFDFDRGRQDLSEHPFSISFNSSDVRVTTRIDEKDVSNMTWSCIHETGHALYEQGLPIDGYGLPAGEACSYSIHESQSRLWENHVGRGLPFWKKWYPLLQNRFPAQLKDVGLDKFYAGINKVEPSLIRTEADEISYHFHVYIRYKLEKELIGGGIKTAEIREFWNSEYKRLLGQDVPDDKRGCLQDVHWSHGSFGYFPTYSLGSFYAAQFFHFAMKEEKVRSSMEAGETEPLLSWLREKIHSKGRLYSSSELCQKVTGKTLDVQHFTSYLLEKYKGIYTL